MNDITKATSWHVTERIGPYEFFCEPLQNGSFLVWAYDDRAEISSWGKCVDARIVYGPKREALAEYRAMKRRLTATEDGNEPRI